MVLLDEIGSSTDPEEGAAIGSAILEYFASQNITTLEIDLEIEGEVFEYGVENYDWITNLKSLKKPGWHSYFENYYFETD